MLYENDGNQNFTGHVISRFAVGHVDRSIFVADMDKDGDFDVLATKRGTQVVWYENTMHHTDNCPLILNPTQTDTPMVMALATPAMPPPKTRRCSDKMGFKRCKQAI